MVLGFFRRKRDDNAPATARSPVTDVDPASVEFCRIMSAETFEQIKRFPIINILPLASAGDDSDSTAFGAGAARVMIRDLMLTRTLSIRGPEDTPTAPVDPYIELTRRDPRLHYVYGSTALGETRVTTRLSVASGGTTREIGRVEATDLARYLEGCAQTVIDAFGANVTDTMRKMWTISRPRSVDVLHRLGAILITTEPGDPKRHEYGLELIETVPDFPVFDELLDEEASGYEAIVRSLLERDPFNPQLYFKLFCAIWTQNGHQPEAMKAIRTAIGLSPGHGKAHMCAPHAAHPDADMLAHSELGYRLLPDNEYGVRNYVAYLSQYGAPLSRYIELMDDETAPDPENPGPYYRLILMLEVTGQYEPALILAERLLKLYDPTMSERTRWCLDRDPFRTRMFEAANLDPLAHTQKMVARFKREVDKGA